MMTMDMEINDGEPTRIWVTDPSWKVKMPVDMVEVPKPVLMGAMLDIEMSGRPPFPYRVVCSILPAFDEIRPDLRLTYGFENAFDVYEHFGGIIDDIPIEGFVTDRGCEAGSGIPNRVMHTRVGDAMVSIRRFDRVDLAMEYAKKVYVPHLGVLFGMMDYLLDKSAVRYGKNGWTALLELIGEY